MNLSDLYRRLENLIRFGVIEGVDLSAKPSPLVTVRTGGLLTQWLPVQSAAAGNARDVHPPTVGEIAIVISPGGDTAQACVITGFFSELFPAPDITPNQWTRTFPDGATFKYDSEAHALTVALPADATSTLISDGGISISGDITLDGSITMAGDISVNGKITASGDVVGAGISLSKHVTTGVRAGGDTSGPPA